jgi:hypothetical protein
MSKALVGKRVELVYTSDPYTDLRPGDKGTVSLVDSMGTVHVKWDSGSSLGLVRGEDQFRVIDAET